MIRAACRAALGALLAAATACGGGGDGPTTPTTPATPATPATPTTPTTGLRDLATPRGKGIGVALGSTFFAGNATYATLVLREFDTVVAENAMKWDAIHGGGRDTFNWASADAIVQFAQTNGLKVRGHTLVWHQQNPAWLRTGTWTADDLRRLLREHVDSVVGRYRGRVYAWDVVNEAIGDNGALRTAGSPWAPLLGAGYVDLAFQHARAADPQALLYYNDYSLEFPGAKQDSAFAMIQRMKVRGVPIDGIGFQGHFQINANGTGVPSKESLKATFARFAALGLRVEVTELDVRVRNDATPAELTAQSAGYATVVAACVESPACDAVVVWGVRDSESWVPGTFPGYGRALLFDEGFGRKAAYDAVQAALGG